MDPLTGRARSWLFVPATRPERFAKAAASGADRVIIDLEDAVAPEAKLLARSLLTAAVIPGGVPAYLRVNGFGTEWFEGDLEAARQLPLTGIVLPKAETPEQIGRVGSVLERTQRIVAIVETAAGVWNALELARGRRVERLAFGAIDFQVDTGIRGDDVELAHTRSRIVLASRVAGIAAPIDAITQAIDDEQTLTRDAARARRFGFAGKLCIHPRQIAGINRAFAPTEQELQWARGLLEALSARPEHERGAFSYLGAMVDRPVIERARQILAAADGTDRSP